MQVPAPMGLASSPMPWRAVPSPSWPRAAALLTLRPAIAFASVADPRRVLALAAARVHPRQPATITAITGTSGKSSVADFTRQIQHSLGHASASLGTIGVVTSGGAQYGSLTTPDPVTLHATLDRLAGDGITHLAMEASSHGLDQRRLDGVHLSAAGFLNLGRDHLDYHPTMEDYLAGKAPPLGVAATRQCPQW
jgi:UDP-N-acetylmuramoyl-L-alanyl-D-glutamate--2,6-diaminopimelate ligase